MYLFRDALDWLVKEVAHGCYVDIGLKITVHENQIVKVEKTIVQKQKPIDGDDTSTDITT